MTTDCRKTAGLFQLMMLNAHKAERTTMKKWTNVRHATACVRAMWNFTELMMDSDRPSTRFERVLLNQCCRLGEVNYDLERCQLRQKYGIVQSKLLPIQKDITLDQLIKDINTYYFS